MSKQQVEQPEWFQPEGNGIDKGLKVSNTMTQNKDSFKPQVGNQVTWYMCGPTVYDSSHMGHARTYLAFDIIRRIFEDYFGYNVFLVMNITDIDDKIILKARQNSLLAEYNSKNKVFTETVKEDLIEAVTAENVKFAETIEKTKTNDKIASSEKKATIKMFEGKINVNEALLEEINKVKLDEKNIEELLKKAASPLASLLDKRHGDKVDIQSLFRQHAEKYELEYLEDMKALGIRPPDVMTRVSEYLESVTKMVSGIVKNGFAYVDDGNVWFDTQAFGNAKDHAYGKLEPWSVGNATLLADGEGALSGGSKGGKKHPNDFALWKKSKPGEPSWESPWGQGRPGWHIECSAMAGELLGKTMDIHSGGMDLKFPHHDNELAQAEAFYPCKQWVNYFLHTGHLHIEGLKMAKSLKNFVTIRQALTDYTARQMRLLFLLRAWDSVMNYSASMMDDEVKPKEKTLTEFFLLVKQIERDSITHQHPQRWGDKELILNKAIDDAQQAVDAAMKDNFNTPEVMSQLFQLVTAVNQYARDTNDASERRSLLVNKAAAYIERILKVFGLIGDNESSWNGATSSGASSEQTELIENLVSALANFRIDVREAAIAGTKDNENAAKALSSLMNVTDVLRNETLPPLGVRLEDDPQFRGAYKIVDPKELLAEAEAKKAGQKEKAIRKLKARHEALMKQKDKAVKGSIRPQDLFKGEADASKLYGSYDDDGLPLTDAAGEPIAKSAAKKMKKQLAAQVKLHKQFENDGGNEGIHKIEESIVETEKELKQLEQQ